MTQRVASALMTVADVAAMFEVTEYTIREWLKNDEISLTGTKMNNGQWRIKREEAERFAQERYGL